MKIKTGTKRTIVMASVQDLPFDVRYANDDKVYVELTNIQGRSSDEKQIRKAYPTSKSSEIKIYLDEIKYLVTDAHSIPVKHSSRPWEAQTEEKEVKPALEINLEDMQAEEPEEISRYDLLKTCIQNDLPVYLHGPAGSGKNYSLQKVADELELNFYFSNSVSQEYKLTGFIDANGTYHDTEFYRAFTEGGLFFLDELDASAPEVLVLLNAAIANRYFEFPNQPRVDAHPDFRVVAAGNTVGTGADEQYTGRMPIDQATLDRFVFIEWVYDAKVEEQLAKGDTDLLEFIRTLRTCHLNTTFSYRAIIAATTLRAQGVPVKTILVIAILKGISKDAMNTIRRNGSMTPYWRALEELQRAS